MDNPCASACAIGEGDYLVRCIKDSTRFIAKMGCISAAVQ
jgi:hypothetical protein